MEDKIPTAEEQAEKFTSTFPRHGTYLPENCKKEIASLLIEFTKLHVEAAVNDIANYVKEFEGSNVYDYVIKNSYPNTKIK